LIGHIEFTAEYLAAHLIILLSLHFFLKIFSFIMMQDSFISTKKKIIVYLDTQELVTIAISLFAAIDFHSVF